MTMEKSYSAGLSSLLIEGGAGLLSSFLKEEKAQRLYQFIAPVIIGDKSGLSYSKDFEIIDMPSRKELSNPRISRLGKDILVTGRL